MSVVELELRDGGALDPASVGEALDAAVERADVEGIFVASVRADAQRLYESGRGLRALASMYGRLVVECNAAIGLVDIRQHRVLSRKSSQVPLVLGGREVPVHTRRVWRVLGCARERGTLGERIEATLQSRDDVGTSTVAEIASREGDTYVRHRDVVATAKAADKGGLSVRAFCESVGLTRSALDGGTQRVRMRWENAVRVAQALDVDPTKWPPAPPSPRGRLGSRRAWITRERAKTGGRWDEAYSRWRLFLDEFARVAPNTDPCFDAAYERLYHVEHTLTSRMKAQR